MFRNHAAIALIIFFTFTFHGIVTPRETMGVEQQQGVVTCTVLETMDAAGYTYFKADTGEHHEWVAIPRATLKAGDNIAYYEGMTMINFFSKTLSRTFETIIFSPGLVSQVPKEIIDAVNATPEIDKKQEDISLPRTETYNALTVKEIYTNRLKLNGETVRLRGKIVKYSPNIMGKNWLHIQDGTGSALDNNYDLVATTTEVPTNMSDITLEGTLAADKDFGSGYRYSVIIEDAAIVK